MSERYIARFDPQVWVNDEAVSVNPHGETEWDCTRFLMDDSDLRAKVLAGLDAGEPEVLDIDDALIYDIHAPIWVRNWDGPCSIWIRREEAAND